VKTKRILGEQPSLDAAVRAGEDDFVAGVGRRAREVERGHEVPACPTTGNEDFHGNELWNPECGMRNLKVGVEAIS